MLFFNPKTWVPALLATTIGTHTAAGEDKSVQHAKGALDLTGNLPFYTSPTQSFPRIKRQFNSPHKPNNNSHGPNKRAIRVSVDYLLKEMETHVACLDNAKNNLKNTTTLNTNTTILNTNTTIINKFTQKEWENIQNEFKACSGNKVIFSELDAEFDSAFNALSKKQKTLLNMAYTLLLIKDTKEIPSYHEYFKSANKNSKIAFLNLNQPNLSIQGHIRDQCTLIKNLEDIAFEKENTTWQTIWNKFAHMHKEGIFAPTIIQGTTGHEHWFDKHSGNIIVGIAGLLATIPILSLIRHLAIARSKFRQVHPEGQQARLMFAE